MKRHNHENPIGPDDVAEALSVLRDVIEWSVAPARWSEVDRSVTALTAALAAGDGSALRYQITVLELLGPVRQVITRGADAPVAPPDPIRERVLAAIADLSGFQMPNAAGQEVISVTIFMSDATGHERVESAVTGVLGSAGFYIVSREDPVEGSWFRRMQAAAVSPVAQQALAAALHTADSRLVLEQDARVTAILMQNVGPLIASLQPTKDAVVRVGAVLLVKSDWVVVVHQLTAQQQLVLDHSPELAAQPHGILNALGLPAAETGTVIPGNPPA
jgi:hypothetical protein